MQQQSRFEHAAQQAENVPAQTLFFSLGIAGIFQHLNPTMGPYARVALTKASLKTK